jgi:hypothetical protein
LPFGHPWLADQGKSMTPNEFRGTNLTLTLPNGASAIHSSPSLLTSERASPAAQRGKFLGSEATSLDVGPGADEVNADMLDVVHETTSRGTPRSGARSVRDSG